MFILRDLRTGVQFPPPPFFGLNGQKMKWRDGSEEKVESRQEKQFDLMVYSPAAIYFLLTLLSRLVFVFLLSR